MREQVGENNLDTRDREDLNQEYHNLMSDASLIVAELRLSTLSEKYTRRLKEFDTRIENIAQVWSNIFIDGADKPKYPFNKEVIKKYNDIFPMLKELLEDMKTFKKRNSITTKQRP